MKRCQICDQKADVYTQVHKKDPFADGRLYDCVCFTCYFVPKIMEQSYAKDGSVSEDKELEYSCLNLCSPKELHEMGAADSLRQAKNSVDAVSKLCLKALKNKSHRIRPKPSWNVS